MRERLKALAGSKKAKAVAEREALARDEAARAEAFRALWLGRSAALVASLGALRAGLAPELARLGAGAPPRRRRARAPRAARAAAARIFYDGTPDRAFSNFAPFALRPLGGLDLAKGEKLFHLVKVTLCGDADCAWRVLQTNDAPALRALGREAAGYSARSPRAGTTSTRTGCCSWPPRQARRVRARGERRAAARARRVGAAVRRRGARDDRRCGIGFHAADGARSSTSTVDQRLGHGVHGRRAVPRARRRSGRGRAPDAAAG